MPTGYTAKLVEEGQDFKTFAMGCARAMGACIEMRDDPHDTPIPERFKPTAYYAERLAESRAELERLLAMSPKEQLAFGEKKRQEDIAHSEELIAKDRAANERLDEMQQKVKAWEPPTPDHRNFKEFMLDQLRVSREDTDFYEQELAEARAKTPADYYAEAVEQARDRIESYAEHNQEEVDLANSRTEWVAKLRESLDSQPTPA